MSVVGTIGRRFTNISKKILSKSVKYFGRNRGGQKKNPTSLTQPILRQMSSKNYEIFF